MLNLCPHATFTSSQLLPPTCPLPLHALHAPQAPCLLPCCFTDLLLYLLGYHHFAAWKATRCTLVCDANSAAIPNGSNIHGITTTQVPLHKEAPILHIPTLSRCPPPPSCAQRHMAAMKPFYNIFHNHKLMHEITPVEKDMGRPTPGG